MNAGRDTPGNVLAPAPVFLVGSERSGTTLLRLMLDHHPEIAFDKEFDFAVTMVSDTGVRPAMEAYRSWVMTVRGMDYEVDPSLTYQELMDDFLRQKRAAAGGKPRLGATVHRNFDRLRFLWPDARYIHLVRDPRDVARSVVLKGWAGNVYQGAAYWLEAERCWDSLALHLSERQAVDVRYEELVTDPEGVLSAICQFIGVDYSPEMLAYSADAPQYPPPDPTLATLWRRKLAPRDVALVEQRIGGLLEKRGYEASGYPRPAVGRLRQTLLVGAGRLERLRSRVRMFGAPLVALDVVGRRAHLPPLERAARTRMNAIEQQMVDEEAAGKRSPSANIPPRSPR